MKRSDVVPAGRGNGGARSDDHDRPARQAKTSGQQQRQNHQQQQPQQAPSELREQKQPQLSSSSSSSSSSPAATNSKLVFGLNSRTNRVKHDEYAEQRRLKQTNLIDSNNSNSKPEQSEPIKAKTSRVPKHESGQKPQEIAERSNQQASKPVVVKETFVTPTDNHHTVVPSTASRVPTLVADSSQNAATRGKKMARRKSIEEDLSTSKIERCTTANNSEANQQFKMRTQFNILPPPQLTMATSGKGSVVSYAKSRIYDKPTSKELQAKLSAQSRSLLDDASGAIPASILSGFKPPKQVNVSKARKEWEGGEPFAKCKSRQRLAAKAAAAGHKKLLHGTWSMTSVVATQQLQLQQALAASSAGVRSNVELSDPSVKVLTRGSVLERIQQYERAPSSGSTSSSSSSVGAARSRSSSSSSLASSLNDQLDSKETPNDELNRPDSPQSKQAQYRTRIASIQHEQHVAAEGAPVAQPQLIPASQTAAAAAAATATPNQTKAQPQGQQQRRLSLRRTSTITTTNSSQLIPKFYHPNGKPNTYEIELQKKNIVACFDKLPDRKAQLVGPNSKRHFHSIALACGFSEYFKMPLNLYAKHCMQNFSSFISTTRKTSTVSLTNGTQSLAPIGQTDNRTKVIRRSNSIATNQPNLKQLTRAASMDSTGKIHPKELENENNSTDCTKYISCDQFLVVWRQLIGQAYDLAAKFIHLLTFGQRSYLLPDDFVPLVQSIIDDHPGLKFLRAAPDFHLRYIQTVIARIYYNINRSWTGKINVNELRRSNLLAVLLVLSQEEDINQITDYFSYEHFYVIYCKFWNLDQDHDLLISKEDLARHNDASISSRIIERIFSGSIVVSSNSLIRQTGKMSYSDFVWFLLAEEDKKHVRSIEYWFRLMDLDGDGYISIYEMEYFYYEQTKRLELMNIEPLPFLDCACQILDLVNPKEKSKISLADLKRTKMAPIFFDTFINLEKYLEHESREFVSTRDLIQDGVLISDWDRYASEEYENLVTEESSV